MAERVKIGTKTFSEAFDRKESLGETAARYQMVHYEPQTADVLAEIVDGKVKSIGYKINGEITEYYSPSLYGGVPISDGHKPEMIGKEYVGHANPYPHEIAISLLEGKDSGFELEVEPLYVPFRDYRQEGVVTYGLFVDPSDELRERSRGVELALSGQPIPSDSPEAVFGWAMATDWQAHKLEEEARRKMDIAAYALRQYAPELSKPQLSTDGIEQS